MNTFRKVCFVACAFLILFSSCNSSKQASKKRRKRAPCDCPTFNYVPHPDVHKTYVASVAGTPDNCM